MKEVNDDTNWQRRKKDIRNNERTKRPKRQKLKRQKDITQKDTSHFYKYWQKTQTENTDRREELNATETPNNVSVYRRNWYSKLKWSERDGEEEIDMNKSRVGTSDATSASSLIVSDINHWLFTLKTSHIRRSKQNYRRTDRRADGWTNGHDLF